MWYFQKKGRTEGPIPEPTLHLAIQKGEIGALDLLFKEGDSRWRSAYEYDALQKYFSERAGGAKEDHWIILSRVKGTKDNKQKGPYRTSEVKMKLQAGEIKYTDYAWKQGMKEWYRITALEIFHGEDRAINQNEMISKAPDLPDEDLLQKVEVLERTKVPAPENRPPEAQGPDLTKVKPKNERSTAPVKSRSKSSPKKNEAPVSGRSLSLWDRFQEMSPSKKWLVGAACIALAVLIAFGSLFFASYQDHRQLLAQVAQKIRPSRPLTTAPDLEPVPAPEVMAPVAEPLSPPMPAQPEAPRVEPSYLKTKITGDALETPVLEVQTDASFHYPIVLTVIGEPGEVLGTRSYYRVTKINDSEKKKFELRNLGLKPGKYRLQIKVGTFDSKANVSVATNSKTYRSDLSAYRKSISYFATNERIQLIKLSEKLDKHNQEFMSQFRSNALDAPALSKMAKAWQKKLDTISSQTLKTISPRTRNQFVYGEYWSELKDLRNQMRKTAMSAAQSKAVGTPEWQEFSQTAQLIKGFNEKMLALSLWK